jgi:hypothetical protein
MISILKAYASRSFNILFIVDFEKVFYFFPYDNKTSVLLLIIILINTVPKVVFRSVILRMLLVCVTQVLRSLRLRIFLNVFSLTSFNR